MSWAEERRVQREKSHDVVSGCDWELEVEGAVSVWVATKRGKDCVLMKYVSVDLEWNVKTSWGESYNICFNVYHTCVTNYFGHNTQSDLLQLQHNTTDSNTSSVMRDKHMMDAEWWS